MHKEKKEWKLQGTKVTSSKPSSKRKEKCLGGGRGDSPPHSQHSFSWLWRRCLDSSTLKIVIVKKKKKILAKNNSNMHKTCRNAPWCKLFMKIPEQHDQELAWLTDMFPINQPEGCMARSPVLDFHVCSYPSNCCLNPEEGGGGPHRGKGRYGRTGIPAALFLKTDLSSFLNQQCRLEICYRKYL